LLLPIVTVCALMANMLVGHFAVPKRQ
jgi:hypothetical protein